MNKIIKMVDMGLNTEPRFKLPEKFNELSEETKKHVQKEVEYATSLREEIHKIMEEDGACRLSWSCTGRTRHEMHAQQWAAALPEYDFQIGYNYECVVTKK